MKSIFKSIFLPILVVALFSCTGQVSDTDDNDWEVIQQCISGVVIDYESGTKVNNQSDVETVFTNFILHSKLNNQDIFGYGNNWRIDSAEKHGKYKEVKYWKVSASWFSEQDQIWRQKEVFDVSEHGDVVRLLGCI